MKNYKLYIKYTLIITLLFSVLACKKDEVEEGQGELEIWLKEDFKYNHSIAFPVGYEGAGMYGFEGYSFLKNRKDNKVKLSYSYCHSLGCEPYGDTLDAIHPETVMALDINDVEILLDTNKYITWEIDTIGHLYFNKEESSTAVLYMKYGNTFNGWEPGYYEGLSIFYEKTEFLEVEEILINIIEY